MRPRKTHRELAGTRIYQRKQRFFYEAPEPVINPATGKRSKSHSLCPVADGRRRALKLMQAIVDYNEAAAAGAGDLPGHMRKYVAELVAKRDTKRPEDPEHAKMYDASTKEIKRLCGKIEEAFTDFNVAQVEPYDIAQFVDQWAGQRTAQVYMSRMSHFMSWCARNGLRSDNPCLHVSVESPGDRDRYITHGEFHAIRSYLAPMPCCYVDLCYLLYQRTTEIRLLKWSQITDAGIHFKPTKTEESSGAQVMVPMTPDIMEVLERARACGVKGSPYVIHTCKGMPYAKNGIWTAWRRARMAAGIGDVTLKDLRAKAVTDAADEGEYEIEQLKVGAAHTTAKQTIKYIKKRRKAPVSEVIMHLPPKPET